MTTYREQAWELSSGQYGYITTAEAAKLGVPSVELAKMAHWDLAHHPDDDGIGRLRRVAHGLYRFTGVPFTPHDQSYEAVARVGSGAHLTADAVLAFHNLALVNPRRIRVGTPRRVRPTLPPWIEMIRQTVPPEDLTSYELVRSTTVARAIRDCVPIVMGSRLHDAVDDAERQGLVRRREVANLHAFIDRPKGATT